MPKKWVDPSSLTKKWENNITFSTRHLFLLARYLLLAILSDRYAHVRIPPNSDRLILHEENERMGPRACTRSVCHQCAGRFQIKGAVLEASSTYQAPHRTRGYSIPFSS